MIDNFFILKATAGTIYLVIAISYGIVFYTRKRFFIILSHILIAFILAFHIFLIIYSSILEVKLPLTSLFDAMSVMALVLAIVYVILEFRLKEDSLGFFVFPLIFLFQAVSAAGSELSVIISSMDSRVFDMPLFGFHTLATVTGYSFFIYSMILGVMYLPLFKEIKKREFHILFDKLPPLLVLEKMNIASLFVGVVCLTLGLVSGIRLTLVVWDRVPFTDPKIFLSLVLWFLYSISLVMWVLKRWNGKRMAYASIFGFLLLLFSFFVVNLAFPTFHRF